MKHRVNAESPTARARARFVSVVVGLLCFGAFVSPSLNLNAAEAQDGSETTLTIGHYMFPPSGANPFVSTSPPASFFWSALFDGLTDVDEKGEVRPALALKWRNPEERTWIFELRPGVSFSNGEPFNADSVAWLIGMLHGPEADRWLTAREARGIASARAVDDMTVELTTAAAMPLLPRFLSRLKMVPPKHWTTVGPEGFAQQPIGTGPFAVVGEWAAPQLDLEAFRDSWRAPKADRLVMLDIGDAGEREGGIVSGALDVAISLTPDTRQRLEKAGGTLHTRHGTAVLAFVYVLSKESPLQDIRVRQALNYAVDKQGLIDRFLLGQTRASGQGLRANVPGYDPRIEPYPYAPEKARELLNDAGYGDGLALAADVSAGGSSNDAAIRAAIAAQLEAVGVHLEMREIPVPQLMGYMFQGDWESELFLMDYNATSALDPLQTLELQSCGWSRPWYCNEVATPIIAAAATESDDKRRNRLLGDVYRLYHDDAPALFLWETVGFDATAAGVVGFRMVNGVLDYAALDRP